MNNHDKIFSHMRFWGCMFICRNAEGVHAYLLKCRKGTWSSVRMLKRYMVNKRLGTPVLRY